MPPHLRNALLTYTTGQSLMVASQMQMPSLRLLQGWGVCGVVGGWVGGGVCGGWWGWGGGVCVVGGGWGWGGGGVGGGGGGGGRK